MPLKKGQWVRVKNRTIVGTIVEQLRADKELPEPERSYKIKINTPDDDTILARPSDIEELPDPAPPEYVLRQERLEELREAERRFLASPSPLNTQEVLKALRLYFPENK